jgi:hypothetical protein
MIVVKHFIHLLPSFALTVQTIFSSLIIGQ